MRDLILSCVTSPPYYGLRNYEEYQPVQEVAQESTVNILDLI